MTDPTNKTMNIEVQVNEYTALPLLRLLLAMEGRSTLDFETGWRLFKRFLEFPVDMADEGATFQVTWAEEGQGFHVFFGRQFGQDLGESDVPGYVFGFAYYFEGSEGHRPPEVEFWATEATPVGRFIHDVESTEAFQTGVKCDWVEGFFHEDEGR